jgi:hypothetical protein
MLAEELQRSGVASDAARVVERVVGRPAGLVVLCGPTGVGKTSLGDVLAQLARVKMLGDLRMPHEIVGGLHQAESEVVVAVVRSGESRGLSLRWRDMGIPVALVHRASVATVTLRRLPRLTPVAGASTHLLVVEVLGPDGCLLTGSLVEEARTLVSAGLATEEAARSSVPEYA